MSRFLIETRRQTTLLPTATVRRHALAPDAVSAEWRAAPLGRLGRRLWVDIDRYLEFFELARGDCSELSAPPRGRRARVRDPFRV